MQQDETRIGMNRRTEEATVDLKALIDKTVERLAHKRTGMRLYEAFTRKCRDHAGATASIPLDELEAIGAEEMRHFKMLTEVLTSLGADPATQTRFAGAYGVASMRAGQLVSDDRTSLAQALEGLLIVELADNTAWELLITLANQSGQNEAAKQFAAALEDDQDHLELVRGWLQHEMLRQATQAGTAGEAGSAQLPFLGNCDD